MEVRETVYHKSVHHNHHTNTQNSNANVTGNLPCGCRLCSNCRFNVALNRYLFPPTVSTHMHKGDGDFQCNTLPFFCHLCKMSSLKELGLMKFEVQPNRGIGFLHTCVHHACFLPVTEPGCWSLKSSHLLMGSFCACCTSTSPY